MTIKKPLSCLACATRRYATASAVASSSKSTLDQPRQVLYYPSTSDIQSHLGSLLHPLTPLPDVLAERIVTQKSAAGKYGSHNARLAFYGKRILKAQLAVLFASRGTTIQPKMLSDVLDSKSLGDNAARALELEKVIRWRSVLGPNGQHTGLFKARGDALQSLVAGLWTIHGANASARFVNTKVFPHLDLPNGLNSVVQELVAADGDLASTSRSALYNPSYLIQNAKTEKPAFVHETQQAQLLGSHDEPELQRVAVASY